MTFECFVYVHLPDQMTAATAGEFRMSEDGGEEANGEFAYGRDYVERVDAISLEPVELGLLCDGVLRTTRSNGIFGAMRDGCPDAWGRQIIDASLGPANAGMSDSGYLLESPDDRAGALGFGLLPKPPAPVHSHRRLSDLGGVMAIADAIAGCDAGRDAGAGVDGVLQAGTGLGGARPKVTIEEEGALWVAKLPHPRDRWNNPRVEHATMMLAKACGVSTAETRIATVAGRDVLLVRRFDRKATKGGYTRIRLLSGLTLLDVDEEDRQRWSYLRLADEMVRHGFANLTGQLAQLFRRLTFNALVSNTDDHPRNHAFLGPRSGWELSPAYDLTPTPAIGQSRRLAMECGLAGRDATRDNILSGCERFQLVRSSAEEIVDAMTTVVSSGWYPAMRAAGVTDQEAGSIRNAFVCEGFGARRTAVQEC